MSILRVQRLRAWTPFAYGFRPFFLLAGLHAAASIGLWLWLYRSGASPLPPMPAQYWHGHEMTFGFVGAAIAGFLLTAVPSWTGSRGVAGAPLVILTLLWLAGRLVFGVGNALPVAVLAVMELAFVPALILVVAGPLLRSGNRNSPLLLLLAAYWATDAVFVYGLATGNPVLGRTALLAALDLVLVLLTIIGGRIVPAFTGNALRAAGLPATVRSSPVVERLLVPVMLVAVVADLVAPAGLATATVAGIAASLHLWRLSGWQGWRTGSQPIVWVLHVAYLWLPLGLALKAVWLAAGAGWAMHWQHALGAGAAGMMILAVMTRAALGHTGRPLRAHPAIAVAYWLLAGAVAVRVFAGPMLPVGHLAVVMLAGALWIATFLVYVVVYGPVLLGPRADGRPG